MPRLLLGLCVALGALTPTLRADESVWLRDFNSARQRAAAEQKPIILDFGTAACFWCKKLDVTTFRDPDVVKRLGEKFIAVKIDADKDSTLAQHLKISSYPTLVFAAPDGRILGQHVGYVDIARFQQQLDRALADSAKSPSPIAVAQAPIAQTPVAMQAVVAISEQPSSSPVLDQVRADFAAGRFARCLDRCKELGPDNSEARDIEKSIKNDPEKIRRAQAELLESLGDVYLANAELALREQRFGEAKTLIDRVQEMCPATPQALAAKHIDLRLQAQRSPQPIFRMQAP